MNPTKFEIGDFVQFVNGEPPGDFIVAGRNPSGKYNLVPRVLGYHEPEPIICAYENQLVRCA